MILELDFKILADKNIFYDAAQFFQNQKNSIPILNIFSKIEINRANALAAAVYRATN